MVTINMNMLGVSRGTAVEEAVKANFNGETAEVGLYLAMARQAQREGYAEVGEALRRIACEEAEHAARFAELNGFVSESTKENLERMLKGEMAANNGKREAAIKAREAQIDEAGAVFDEASRDELRHANMIKGFLDRLFK